jgi:hypothetical protein
LLLACSLRPQPLAAVLIPSTHRRDEADFAKSRQGVSFSNPENDPWFVLAEDAFGFLLALNVLVGESLFATLCVIPCSDGFADSPIGLLGFLEFRNSPAETAFWPFVEPLSLFKSVLG